MWTFALNFRYICFSWSTSRSKNLERDEDEGESVFEEEMIVEHRFIKWEQKTMEQEGVSRVGN